ncbi:MAG: hypothetical protein ACRDRI_20835 [Pseudonocardiaceae bacterium]
MRSGAPGPNFTLADTETFLRYLLDPATTPDKPGFGPAWVAESLQPTPGDLQPARGLFWLPAPGTDPTDDSWNCHGSGSEGPL